MRLVGPKYKTRKEQILLRDYKEPDILSCVLEYLGSDGLTRVETMPMNQLLIGVDEEEHTHQIGVHIMYRFYRPEYGKCFHRSIPDWHPISVLQIHPSDPHRLIISMLKHVKVVVSTHPNDAETYHSTTTHVDGTLCIKLSDKGAKKVHLFIEEFSRSYL